MAERSDKKMDDPLNLMRVMPPKGRQPCSSAWLSFATDGHRFSRISEGIEFNHLCFICV